MLLRIQTSFHRPGPGPKHFRTAEDGLNLAGAGPLLTHRQNSTTNLDSTYSTCGRVFPTGADHSPGFSRRQQLGDTAMRLRPKQPTGPRPFHQEPSLAGPKHMELWRVKEARPN